MQKGKVVETLDLPIEPKLLIKKMFGDSSNDKNNNKIIVNQSNKKVSLNISKFPNLSSIEIPQGTIIGVSGLQGSGSDKFIQAPISVRLFTILA